MNCGKPGCGDQRAPKPDFLEVVQAGYLPRNILFPHTPQKSDPLGPLGSSSLQYRRTPEIVLWKDHASCRITSSPPLYRGSRPLNFVKWFKKSGHEIVSNFRGVFWGHLQKPQSLFFFGLSSFGQTTVKYFFRSTTKM